VGRIKYQCNCGRTETAQYKTPSGHAKYCTFHVLHNLKRFMKVAKDFQLAYKAELDGALKNGKINDALFCDTLRKSNELNREHYLLQEEIEG